jgi:hypothetical protein
MTVDLTEMQVACSDVYVQTVNYLYAEITA